jgi:hypothetical protein
VDLETRRAFAVMRNTVTRIRDGNTATQLALALSLADRPREFKQPLTAIAVGQSTVAVTWTMPIDGDYVVIPTIICAAPNVGLLTAGLQASSQTPTGCTVIVANRSAGQIAAAVLDVLIHPVVTLDTLASFGLTPKRT